MSDLTDRDDSDLAAPFDSLHAPRSTAAYHDRRPSPPGDRARSSMRVGGAALAVVLTLAGAVAVLELRGARQASLGGAAAGGGPAARTGAAMAYDSSTGRTVMFGGLDATGRALTDTWSWDGSSWARLGGSAPGALVAVQASDDPADGGVLLVGMPEPISGVTSTGCAVPGSAGGTASTVTPTTSVAMPPSPGATPVAIPASPGASPGAIPPTAAAPSPTDVTPGPSMVLPAPVSPPGLPICPEPSPTATPVLQTWLLTGSSWTRVAASSTAGPPAVSTMAYDAGTGEVVAVEPPSPFAMCGPVLGAGMMPPAIACPVLGLPTKAPIPCLASKPCPAPCSQCGGGGGVSTWSWSHGAWTSRPSAGGPRGVSAASVVAGPADRNAILVAASVPCTAVGSAIPNGCGVATTQWTWAGSAWESASSPLAPLDSLGVVARVEGETVAVLSSGETVVLGSSGWTTTSSRITARLGEAVAPAPGGGLVLFGGSAEPPLRGEASSSAGTAGGVQPGSDTWLWRDRAWAHLAGSAPSSPPAQPNPCPTVSASVKGCVVPMPGVVGPPASPPEASPLGGRGSVRAPSPMP